MNITSQIKKGTLFGIVFSLAKAIIYFVPLLLAEVLSKEDYGVLEYALAGIATLVSTIINLGVPGAYPYFILKQKKAFLKEGFYFHSIVLFFFFLMNQILYLNHLLSFNIYFAFNISYVLANQLFFSTQLKSNEKPVKAVLLDSALYFVLLIYYLIIKTSLINLDFKGANYFVLIYAAFYIINAGKLLLKISLKRVIHFYKIITKFSVHILISTFLIFLISVSGRILVEFFFDYETVGIYSYYFRLSAVVVMIHQIANIVYFKKIYTLNPHILDNYFYLFFIFIFILSLSFYFIFPKIIIYFSDFFNLTFQNNKAVYFLLSSQMVLWIASALNSNIIDRENLAAKNNIRFIVLILLGIVTLFIFKDQLTFSRLVFIHFSSIFIACLIQYYSLFKKSIFFCKSLFSLILFYLLTSSFYFFYF